MTVEILKQCGIPLDSDNDDAVSVLYAESALDWILNNTTLNFDKNDPEAIQALPAGAKLFVVKFMAVMMTDNTVTSESLGGMSQSFSTSSKYDLLMDLARELIGKYLKSDFKFIAAENRWNY